MFYRTCPHSYHSLSLHERHYYSYQCTKLSSDKLIINKIDENKPENKLEFTNFQTQKIMFVVYADFKTVFRIIH